MKPIDEHKQTTPEPDNPPEVVQHMFEAPPSLRQDQFISATNEKVYAFQHDQKHLSLKQRFGLMSRAKKILSVVGAVSTVFVISVIALSIAVYQPAKKPSASLTTQTKPTVISTTDLNNDGKVDTTDTKLAIGDVNGDGVVDDADITFAEADVNGDGVIDSNDVPVSEEDVSWWQSLLSKVQGNSSNDTSSDTNSDVADSSDTTQTGSDEDTSTPPTDEELLAENEDPGGNLTEAEVNDPVTAVPAPSTYTGSGTAVTLASWNILWWHNAASNAKNGIQAILQKAQVVGLQEVGTDAQKKIIDNLASSSVGVYHPAGIHTPIVWDNTVYQKVTSGYKRTVKSGIVKNIAYVKLRNRSTGQQFYMFNFHATVGVSDNPSQGCSSTVCNVYKYEMSTLSAYINAHKSDNLPIFVTGDYNSNYRASSTCKITWLACATFRSIGLKSGFEYTQLAGIGTTASTIGSSDRLIDYVYSWQRSNVEPVSVAIIGPNAACHRDSYGQNHCWNGSDHKPSLFTVKLH